MKNKKVWYIAIPAAIVAGALTVSFILFGPVGAMAQADRPETTLGEHLPIDADTAVITPSGEDWWGTIASFAPIAFQLKAHEPSDELNINYYGYSRSPNHQETVLPGTGPLQVLYLESGTEDEAQAVASWLQDEVANDSNGLAVKTFGQVNTLSFNWAVLGMDQTDKPLSGDPLFTTDVPLMWMNYDKLEDTVQAPASAGSGEAPQVERGEDEPSSDVTDVTGVLRTTLGITSGTVWKATSKDGGKTWGGQFVAGGIDKAQINVERANKIVDESSRVVMEDTSAESDSAASVKRLMTPGLLPFRNIFGLQYADSDEKFGSADPKLDGLSRVSGEIVSGRTALGTQHIDMASPGSGTAPISFDGSQISASETEMNMKLTDSGASDSLYMK